MCVSGDTQAGGGESAGRQAAKGMRSHARARLLEGPLGSGLKSPELRVAAWELRLEAQWEVENIS